MISWLVFILFAVVAIEFQKRLSRVEQALLDLADGSYAPDSSSVEVESASEEPALPLVEDVPTPEPAAQTGLWGSPVIAEADLLEQEQPEEPQPRFRVDFEELFGRRLPIWAGGITLAIAGMLIVKLSIDTGLLTPPIRVIAGILFGTALIAAAEVAYRQEHRVRDPRVRQSLAGAGIASLYASILIAVNVYGLIEPLGAMTAMAAVTAAALFLSIRFGPPSALLGLAGGLAAPALIGSAEPNVPLLTLYLALAVGGLTALSRNQRWAWLGVSALVGGFGWGLVLLLGGALDAPGSISLGLYMLLLGVGIPALGFAGDRQRQLQLFAGIAAAAQMAALIATGGFALLNWGLFALLALASLWLARRDEQLARLPAVGALIALLLLGAWPNPDARDFALVTTGTVLIYGLFAAWRLWHSGGSLLEAAQVAALGLGALFLPMLHFYELDRSTDAFFGSLALGLAAAVAGCAALGLRSGGPARNLRFAILATGSVVLLCAAAILLLPGWLAAPAVAVIGLCVLLLGQRVGEQRMEGVAWAIAAVGAVAIPFSDAFEGAFYADGVDALRWTLLAAIASAFAWRARLDAGRATAQFVTVLFVYFGLSQLIEARFEPLIPPLLLLAASGIGRRLEAERLFPAMACAALLIAAWALLPVLDWAEPAIASMGGIAMFATEVPDPDTAVLRLVLPAVVAAVALWLATDRLDTAERRSALGLIVVLAAIGAHSLYKQLFAIASLEEFVTLGLAERTIWQALLLCTAAAAFQRGQARLALGLAAAAVGHLAWYSLLLHNPLWSAQAVGATPIFNLLLAVFGVAIALTVAARQRVSGSPETMRVLGAVQMVLVALFAFSTLRQLFHGSLLFEPGLSSAEDIGRSIVAIALAIGFLVWGIARRDRDWRIASLALMIAAVGKVFLFDASGLEGLTRIASFFALGVSLIGIGWLYARYLGADQQPRTQPAG